MELPLHRRLVRSIQRKEKITSLKIGTRFSLADAAAADNDDVGTDDADDGTDDAAALGIS